MKNQFTPVERKFGHVLSQYSGADIDEVALTNDLESKFSEEELMELVGSDLMSFDGTFKDQRNANRVVTMKIVGNASNDDTLYINPDSSIKESDNGHPVSGKGVAGNTLTITVTPGNTSRLYRWLELVPSNCMGIRVNSTDANQVLANFEITEFQNGPFDDGLKRTITTASHANEQDNRTDMITVNERVFFDRNTRVSYPIAKGVTVTLTLFMGARLDMVKTAQKAVNNALSRKQTKIVARPKLSR